MERSTFSFANETVKQQWQAGRIESHNQPTTICHNVNRQVSNATVGKVATVQRDFNASTRKYISSIIGW
jgi:hypothetical protein